MVIRDADQSWGEATQSDSYWEQTRLRMKVQIVIAGGAWDLEWESCQYIDSGAWRG